MTHNCSICTHLLSGLATEKLCFFFYFVQLSANLKLYSLSPMLNVQVGFCQLPKKTCAITSISILVICWSLQNNSTAHTITNTELRWCVLRKKKKEQFNSNRSNAFDIQDQVLSVFQHTSTNCSSTNWEAAWTGNVINEVLLYVTTYWVKKFLKVNQQYRHHKQVGVPVYPCIWICRGHNV